jgi:serine/threonine protein kinase
MLAEQLLGKTIAGRLRITELLGEGAMAYVYLAEHLALGKKFAVKVLRQNLLDEPELVERFRREARAASRLSHPSIVYIADFGQAEDGRPYLVMENVDGPSVRQAIEDALPGVLPVPRVLQLLEQVADALAVAHDAGVIHRDLKPDNLRLTTDHLGEERVKVLDFGLAKIVTGEDWDTITKAGQVFGTPPYMSPEQIQGADLDTRTDLYSLGVIAFELLSGRLPFERDSIRGFVKAHRFEAPPPLAASRPPNAARLPPGLEALVMRLLEKDRDRRPGRASELARELAELRSRVPVRGPGSTRTDLHRQVRETAVSELATRETVPLGGLPGLAPTQSWTEPTPEPAPGSGPTEAPEARDTRLRAMTLTVAATLRDLRLGTPDLTRGIVYIRENDDQLLALQGKIASLTEQLQRIQADTDERAARLRHAVVDLRMERERLSGDGVETAALAADLDYQIDALERRLAETQVEQEDACEALKTQLRRLRPAAVDLRLLAQHFTTGLLQLIVAAAPQVTEPRLRQSIDELRGWMSEAG